MSLPVPSVFPGLKNPLYQPDGWWWLFEFGARNGQPFVANDGSETFVRLTSAEVPIVAGLDGDGDPITWYPFPVGFGNIDSDTSGGLPGLTVTISNVARVAMRFMVAHDMLRGGSVRIAVVPSAFVNDPSATLTFMRGSILQASADEEAISFSVSAWDFTKSDVPGPTITRTCRKRYRTAACGFTGDPSNTLGDCRLAFEDCEARGVWEADNGQAVRHPGLFGGAHRLPFGPAPIT